MKKNLMMALVAVSIATSAWADSSLAPADSSRVYDLDEVVVVSQSKEYAKLRQQQLDLMRAGSPSAIADCQQRIERILNEITV